MEFIEYSEERESQGCQSLSESFLVSDFASFWTTSIGKIRLKVSSGDNLGLILSHACFPGLDSLNENVQLNALLLLQL